jgi:hypothetical protein
MPEDLGVLAGDRGAQVGEHTGRQAELAGQGVEMPGARAGSGADHELVSALGVDELLDDREHRRPAAVDDALPAVFRTFASGRIANSSAPSLACISSMSVRERLMTATAARPGLTGLSSVDLLAGRVRRDVNDDPVSRFLGGAA